LTHPHLKHVTIVAGCSDLTGAVFFEAAARIGNFWCWNLMGSLKFAGFAPAIFHKHGVTMNYGSSEGGF
jgi:hypothetical protein